MLFKLPMPPDQENYGVTKAANTITTEVAGGAPRYRLNFLNGTYTVSVLWRTDSAGFTFLNNFFNIACQSGSLPFLIDLYMDKGELTEHTARFVPGTFALSAQRGMSFEVSAQLDVEPMKTTQEDELVFAIQLIFGSGSEPVIVDFSDKLHTLINVTMPVNYPYL